MWGRAAGLSREKRRSSDAHTDLHPPRPGPVMMGMAVVGPILLHNPKAIFPNREGQRGLAPFSRVGPILR